MGNKNILGCIESNDNQKEDEEYKKLKTEENEILNKISITEDDYPKDECITKKSDTSLRRGNVISTTKNLPQIKPNFSRRRK